MTEPESQSAPTIAEMDVHPFTQAETLTQFMFAWAANHAGEPIPAPRVSTGRRYAGFLMIDAPDGQWWFDGDGRVFQVL